MEFSFEVIFHRDPYFKGTVRVSCNCLCFSFSNCQAQNAMITPNLGRDFLLTPPSIFKVCEKQILMYSFKKRNLTRIISISSSKTHCHKSSALKRKVIICCVSLSLCLHVQISLWQGIESTLLPLRIFSHFLSPLTFKKYVLNSVATRKRVTDVQ